MADLRDLLLPPGASSPVVSPVKGGAGVAPQRKPASIELEVRTDRPWRHVEAHLVRTGVVVLAYPSDPALAQLPEEDPKGHNCDAMGCGTAHVLFRFLLPPQVCAVFAPAFDRAEAEGMLG